MYDQVKCLYGLPTSNLLVELQSWLRVSNRLLVIIEDSLEGFFNPIEGAKIYFLNPENEEESLKQIAWDFVFTPFELSATPGNPSKSLPKMKEVFQKLSSIQLGVHLTASEYRGRGIDLLRNILNNNAPSKRGADLFGAFKGVPAIVCGGGASLEKNSETLKSLKDRALIFSGGAGLNTLNHFGINPHFAAGVDPNPCQRRFLEQNAFETSFFYQSRFNFDQLNSWQGQCLWIEGSGSLPIEEWLFSSEPFECGWNVATFLVRLSYELGCDPIVLCGVDLGSKSPNLYPRVVERQKGDLFYTKDDWIMAGQWLGEFASGRADRIWINCSDGLELEGFAKKQLAELPLDTMKDLAGLVFSKVQKIAEFKMDRDQVARLMQSFHTSYALCDKLLQIMEKHYPCPPQQKGEYVISEVELEEEVAYQQFLLPVWNIWKQIIQREIEPNVPKAYGLDVHRLLFMKRVCDEAKQLPT